MAMTGCPGGAETDASDPAPPAEPDRDTGVPTTPPASASVDAPFAGIEALRPDAWAGWPLENVDPQRYYGWRIDPVRGGFEREPGLVLASDPGAFALAIADGRVAEVRRDGDDHLELTIDHGQGVESHCGPLSDALVHAGLPVTRGAAIGLAAGSSLRLRVSVDGLDLDPLLALRQPLHRWPGLLRVLPAPAPPAPAP